MTLAALQTYLKAGGTHIYVYTLSYSISDPQLLQHKHTSDRIEEKEERKEEKIPH